MLYFSAVKIAVKLVHRKPIVPQNVNVRMTPGVTQKPEPVTVNPDGRCARCSEYFVILIICLTESFYAVYY